MRICYYIYGAEVSTALSTTTRGELMFFISNEVTNTTHGKIFGLAHKQGIASISYSRKNGHTHIVASKTEDPALPPEYRTVDFLPIGISFALTGIATGKFPHDSHDLRDFLHPLIEHSIEESR